MCIIESKTHFDSDGHARHSEKRTYCSKANGHNVCPDVRYKVFEANVVEGRPSSAARDSRRDNLLVTEGLDGRRHVYQDLSHKSSGSSSLFPRSRISASSAISIPSSTSSLPVPELEKITSPTPPMPPRPAFEATNALPERSRMPYPPPETPEPRRTLASGGTAVYNRPPPLNLSRATENERFRPEKQKSASSMTAVIDDARVPSPPKQPRRFSTATPVNLRDAYKFPLERTPVNYNSAQQAGHVRQGSAGDLRPALRRSETLPPRNETETEEEKRRRRRERHEAEDPRISVERDRRPQADLQERATDVADAATARDASIERHRANAVAILEGRRQREDDIIRARRQSERSQIERERAAAHQQHQSQDSQFLGGRSSRAADALVHRNPTAARGPVSTLSARPSPIVHQAQTPPRRSSNAIRDLGDSIIAREQVRVAHANLTNRLSRDSLEEAVIDDGSHIGDHSPNQLMDSRPIPRSRRESFLRRWF